MQVEFLVLLLNGEVTLRLRTTALKCLHFIFIMGMRPSLVSESVVKTLFSFVDGAEVPPTMQCQALRILHKVSPKFLIQILSFSNFDWKIIKGVLELVLQFHRGLLCNGNYNLQFCYWHYYVKVLRDQFMMTHNKLCLIC